MRFAGWTHGGAAVIGPGSGGGTGGFTSGSVIFANSTGALNEDNANFFYNEAGGQLRLAKTGSAGGVLIGGTALLHEAGANILATPDTFRVINSSLTTSPLQLYSGASAIGDIGAFAFAGTTHLALRPAASTRAVLVMPFNEGSRALLVGSAAAQTADLTQWLDSAGGNALAVTAARDLIASIGTAFTIGTADAFGLQFQTGGTIRWIVTSAGALVPNTVSSSDFGLPGTRIRDGYYNTRVGVHNGSAFTAHLSASALNINAVKVVGAQGAAIADASGGATVDAEARTAINALLARARAHGLIAT